MEMKEATLQNADTDPADPNPAEPDGPESDKSPRPTALRAEHQRAGARLVDFAGWELPIQYDGIQAEHRVVREQAGIFDVSHMGRVSVTGTGARLFLDQLLPYDMSRLQVGRMAYTVMCNDQGGTIDDLAVYRTDNDQYLLVINAARVETDLQWLLSHLADTGNANVELTPHASGAMLAVQGPRADALVAGLVGAEAGQLGFFRCLSLTGNRQGWLVSRSGYTGEDGFELICPSEDAVGLWRALLEAGARPAGLAARDVLRLEAGLCLYGNELTESVSPLEAGLGWTLALDKAADFPGKQALRLQRDQGVDRRLVGLRLLDRGIPRAHQAVHCGQRAVGEVSSGTHSPVLGAGIAMAYVNVDVAEVGTRLQVEGRSRGVEAEVVPLPFVPSRVKRRRRRTTTAGGNGS